MTNSPKWGRIVPFFYLQKSGIQFLKRHKLGAQSKRAIRKGIHEAKREIESWLLYFWARKTGKLVHSVIKFLNRNVWNNLQTTFLIALGSDVHYFPYVLLKKGVNWTNTHTAAIEGKMLKKLLDECSRALRKHIPDQLELHGLGWMTGRGKLPKQLEVYTSRGNPKKIPKYRGVRKILQWLR